MIYNDRNRGILKNLDQVAADALQLALKEAEERGLEVLLTQGLRTKEEQDELYAQGRTKPGAIVTYVRGGDSFHNWGVAVDFVPVDGDGNILWNGNYDRFASIAKKYGADWGWDLWNFDKPHLQITQGQNINYFKTGGRLKTINNAPVKSWWAFWMPSYQTQLKNAVKALRRTKSASRRRSLARKIERLEKKVAA